MYMYETSEKSVQWGKSVFILTHDNVCVEAKIIQETQTAKNNLGDNNRSLYDSFNCECLRSTN